MRPRARKPHSSTEAPPEQMDMLLKSFSAAHPAVDTGVIEQAYVVAAHAHHRQTRKSGDPYISHPIEVALIVTQLGMSPEVVCAALLHDVVEHKATNPYKPAQIREEFGEEIAELVDGVCKLDRSGNAEEALRRIEVAVRLNTDRAALLRSREVAVVVLKLADRLHNMRTLRYVPPSTQQRKSRETLRDLVPLARLLGMKTVQRELDDLASAILFQRLDDQRPRTMSERALEAAVVLLPRAERARWVHEWAGELSTLPTRQARAGFALQMLRGMPQLAMELRRPTPRRDTTRQTSTVVERIVAMLSVGAMFVAATTRWEPLAWTAGAALLGGLVLLGAVLFARSEHPARRLRDLIRAWRDPVSTTRPTPRQRNSRRRT